MKLTQRRLNRATLQRQMLLRREAVDPAEAVRRVVALQAQEPASPYVALWNRVAGFDGTGLDRALAEGTVVKATVMRMTVHAVAAADYSPFHEAMQPTLRSAGLLDERFRVSGLTTEEADALVPDLLAFTAEPRTNVQVEAWLRGRLGERAVPGVWRAFRAYAPLWHSPTGGTWSFGARPTRVAARRRDAWDRGDALRHLFRRYLEGFGPASVADFAMFAMIRKPNYAAALEPLLPRLVRHEGPDGAVLYDLPGAELPPEDTPAPSRLLPMWDSVLLAHADRSRIIATEHRKIVARSNGDVLPTLLVDGRVVGVWRAVGGGIEAAAFVPLADDAWEGLDNEARGLLAFLATRDPAVYARHNHWWASLPASEARLLGPATAR